MGDRRFKDALSAWRQADRELSTSSDGDRDRLRAEVERRRDDFQRLSADYMSDRIDALHDAEQRRRSETPSSDRYHEAAREEAAIAHDVFESSRLNDEETPGAPDRSVDL
jgi:hypothetical protein